MIESSTGNSCPSRWMAWTSIRVLSTGPSPLPDSRGARSGYPALPGQGRDCLDIRPRSALGLGHVQVAVGHRLLRYIRIKRRIDYVPFSRANIYARDRHHCQYCGHLFPTSDLTFDHVIPVAQGGRKDWENIVTCCVTCNRRKGGRTPRKLACTCRATRGGPIRRRPCGSRSGCATRRKGGGTISTGTWSWTTRRNGCWDMQAFRRSQIDDYCRSTITGRSAWESATRSVSASAAMASRPRSSGCT